MYQATTSEQLSTLCLKRKHCVIVLLDKELSKGEAARIVVKLLYEFRTVSFVTVRTAHPHAHRSPTRPPLTHTPTAARRPHTHRHPPARPPSVASPACALARTPTSAARRSTRRATSSR